MEPLQQLFEAPGLPGGELPEALRRLYGGQLGMATPALVANFVGSVDGVVSLGDGTPNDGSLIAGGSEADRFVMGLLRALSGAVVIGAGTLRGSPGHRWSPGGVHPPSAELFAGLRRRLGFDGDPEVVVVTARGDIDERHPAIAGGALVVTTDEGAAALRGRIVPGERLLALGAGPRLDLAAVVASLRARGLARLLTEGGPQLLAGLLEAQLLDELFLTVSPLLLGRDAGPRPGLVSGMRWSPGAAPRLELVSARRDASHLFLRYALEVTPPRASAAPAAARSPR